jgi:hypothetical protein
MLKFLRLRGFNALQQLRIAAHFLRAGFYYGYGADSKSFKIVTGRKPRS